MTAVLSRADIAQMATKLFFITQSPPKKQCDVSDETGPGNPLEAPNDLFLFPLGKTKQETEESKNKFLKREKPHSGHLQSAIPASWVKTRISAVWGRTVGFSEAGTTEDRADSPMNTRREQLNCRRDRGHSPFLRQWRAVPEHDF